VRRVPTGARGIFLLYEPTRRFDEDRAAYLDRFHADEQALVASRRTPAHPATPHYLFA
jgi:hypothetical protein